MINNKYPLTDLDRVEKAIEKLEDCYTGKKKPEQITIVNNELVLNNIISPTNEIKVVEFDNTQLLKEIALFIELFKLFKKEIFSKGIYREDSKSKRRLYEDLSYIALAYDLEIINNYDIWFEMYWNIESIEAYYYEELEEEIYQRIPYYLLEFREVIDNLKKRDYNRSFYDSIKKEDSK